MPTLPFDQAALRLRPTDDVAVLKRPLKRETILDFSGAPLALRRDIPAGHKVALHAIPAGAPVRKYGQIIGFASQSIEPGDHVHTHNLAMGDFARSYDFCTDVKMLRPPE